MATSTIPTLKANLKAALDTLAATNGNALHNVRISYGAPLPGDAREFVWLGDADGDQQWAAIGHQRREEDYQVTVTIFAAKEGTDQQATTERAFAMAAAIETQLRSDPTVAGAVRVCGFGGQIKLEERASQDGKRRGALLDVTLTCKARI